MRAPEVKALVDILTERVDNTNRALNQLSSDHKGAAQLFNDHRRELEKEIVLLRRDVDELKTGRDVWGGRVFTVALSLASAVVSALLTYYLKKP